MNAGQKDAVVLDLTHAGIPVAKEMARLGYNVRAIDVYDTLDDATISDLQQFFSVLSSNDEIELNLKETVVAPVHLNPDFQVLKSAREKGNPVLTHHKMVGQLINESKRLAGQKVIEITGTKAKTSTASLLADIISRKQTVLLHTSRGLEYWKEGIATVIHKGLSIAPGSILIAIEIMEKERIRPEVIIFETSIGGTGCADIGVITSLGQDYRIASGTAWASDAKLQMIQNAKAGSIVVISSNADKAITSAREKNIDTITFSDEADNVADVNITTTGNEVSIHTANSTIRATTTEGFDVSAYTIAIAAASAIAVAFGADEEDISETVRDFKGLTGRMTKSELENRILIDNSNSGMDILSVEKALDYALTSEDGKVVIVLGEEAEQVCEGLPPENVSDLLQRKGKLMDKVILVGTRMRDIKYDNAYYVRSLEEGIETALINSTAGDIILSCVKCFR
ncbi:coenzyme F430 synthase [Methanococcoides sp. SA1]|nr:coenzyme F430 synthase [Methanococcoides sp. SA1]